MNPSTLFLRRLFWLALVFFIPIFTLTGWLAALVSLDSPEWLETLGPIVSILPSAGALAGLITALVFRFSCGVFLKKILGAKEKKASVKEIKGTASENSEARKAKEERTYLHLISVLQKEARLLDFFAEDLEMYEDDQIGAAVRPVHENAQKTLARYLDMIPVMDEEEGNRITIPKGFDPARIKLVGKVAGDPPFQGILRHRGWRTKGIRMPEFSEAKGADVLTPSEVEIL